MSLPEKLVCLRKEKRLTQLELAEMLKVSRQAVSRWETGDAVPSTENLKCLSDLYSVPLDDLLNENAEKPERKPGPPERTGEEKGAARGRVWKWLLPVGVLLALLVATALAALIGTANSGDSGRQKISIGEMEGEVIETLPREEFDIEW